MRKYGNKNERGSGVEICVIIPFKLPSRGGKQFFVTFAKNLIPYRFILKSFLSDANKATPAFW